MAIAAILTVLAAMAITASAQAPAPKRTVIRAGRVLNVRTGELRANQAIVIEGDKIAKIAPSSEVTAAAGDTTIDLPDATVLPGLIDMHTHLTFELSSLSYTGLGISTARERYTARETRGERSKRDSRRYATSARKIMRTSPCVMPSMTAM